MISDIRKYRAGKGIAVAISAVAVTLVAAASTPEANRERLRAMPPEERGKLLANLRKFDLELAPEQQSALRELDRRLSELSPEERDRYLLTLRRYHQWLDSLPETRQSEIASRPPGERMALVRKFLRDRPLPTGDTPELLRVIEPGEFSPFELASAYKIWQALDANQRTQVERKTQERMRRATLFRMGERLKKIPRETEPEDFDEERWIRLAQELLSKTRPVFLMEEAPKKKLDDALKKQAEMVRREWLRRQAIDLYVSRAEIRPVDPGRLTRFLSSLPEWVQASLHSLAPDEARRRASFAYRLVFPFPQEIPATPTPAGSGTKAQAAPASRPATSAPPKRPPAPTGPNEAPF